MGRTPEKSPSFYAFSSCTIRIFREYDLVRMVYASWALLILGHLLDTRVMDLFALGTILGLRNLSCAWSLLRHMIFGLDLKNIT